MKMTGTADNINIVLERWCIYVIKIWIEKMQIYNVANASAQKFVHHIISSANGDAARIEFAFKYVLKFTDMGVGRGYKLFNENSRENQKLFNRGHDMSNIARGHFNKYKAAGERGRIEKPWYSKTFLLEVRKLANIMAANYAHRAAIMIVENVDDNATKHKPTTI